MFGGRGIYRLTFKASKLPLELDFRRARVLRSRPGICEAPAIMAALGRNL